MENLGAGQQDRAGVRIAFSAEEDDESVVISTQPS